MKWMNLGSTKCICVMNTDASMISTKCAVTKNAID